MALTADSFAALEIGCSSERACDLRKLSRITHRFHDAFVADGHSPLVVIQELTR